MRNKLTESAITVYIQVRGAGFREFSIPIAVLYVAKNGMPIKIKHAEIEDQRLRHLNGQLKYDDLLAMVMCDLMAAGRLCC